MWNMMKTFVFYLFFKWVFCNYFGLQYLFWHHKLNDLIIYYCTIKVLVWLSTLLFFEASEDLIRKKSSRSKVSVFVDPSYRLCIDYWLVVYAIVYLWCREIKFKTSLFLFYIHTYRNYKYGFLFILVCLSNL
jgi:hypothetical protein